ncbi:ABC transporter substrate-binding protein [Rhizobium binxianense]
MAFIKDYFITRRQGLSMMLGGLVAAAAASRASGAVEQTTLTIGGNRDPQLGAQIAIAVKKGLFKDEGLDLSVTWTEAGGDLIPLLAGGAINVAGLGITSVAALSARGIKARAVCGLCDYSGSQALVLKPGLTLASPKDLAGLKFAAPPTDPHEMALNTLGKQYGFDSKQIKIVRMQPSEAVIATARGDVDGALTFQPHLYKLMQMGATPYFSGTSTWFDGKETVLPPEKHLIYVYSLMIANEEWLAKNPNTMLAIIRAVIKANDVIVSNRPEAEQILADFLHAEPEAIKQSMNQNIYGIALDDTLIRSFGFASDWLQDMGQITQPINPADVLEPKLLAQIDPKLVTYKV